MNAISRIVTVLVALAISSPVWAQARCISKALGPGASSVTVIWEKPVDVAPHAIAWIWDPPGSGEGGFPAFKIAYLASPQSLGSPQGAAVFHSIKAVGSIPPQGAEVRVTMGEKTWTAPWVPLLIKPTPTADGRDTQAAATFERGAPIANTYPVSLNPDFLAALPLASSIGVVIRSVDGRVLGERTFDVSDVMARNQLLDRAVRAECLAPPTADRPKP